MGKGFLSSTKRRVVCLVLLFLAYYIYPNIEKILTLHKSSYSEEELLRDLVSCGSKDGASKVYKGYTHPCDVQGVNKYSFAKVLAKRSSSDKQILIMMVDRGSLDFCINLYETSLVKQNIQNYLFVSVDESACIQLLNKNIACFLYKKDVDASHDSVYYSEDFLRKMNYRTFMILDALKLGYTILHSDVDMFFYKNPFDEILCKRESCDMAMLNDYNLEKDKSNFNAGFVYMNPTNNTIEVYKHMQWMAFHVKADDQMQLNRAIAEVGYLTSGFIFQSSNRLKVFYLNKENFLSGSYFWRDGAVSFLGEETFVHPIVVHNNWLVSLIAKEYRFKEMQMWMYDKDHYFSDPHRKYMVYTNSYVFESAENTSVKEVWALRNALAISQILQRTLILPYFHCDNKVRCNILRILSLRHLHKEFPDFREHIFLDHPKVPDVVKKSLSTVYAINSATGEVSLFNSKHLKGASSGEIRRWFGDKTAAVLRFDSLYSAFYEFDDEQEQKVFDEKIKRAFKSSDYVQRESSVMPMRVQRL